MIVNYKGFKLVLDFSKNGIQVPTIIKNFYGEDVEVDDISKAKKLIDSALGE